jgi:hypothetical protein
MNRDLQQAAIGQVLWVYLKSQASFAPNQARAICKGVPEGKGRGRDRQEQAQGEATVPRNASLPLGAIARLLTGLYVKHYHGRIGTGAAQADERYWRAYSLRLGSCYFLRLQA